MGAFFSIVRATALEISCDAFAMLLTLAALALSTFAGALHYHQFGDPTRMAREAGLSAILAGGLVFAIIASVRTVRREIEAHTIDMALAHSISRSAFICAKFAGVALAYTVFFLTVCANSITAVRGAAIGAQEAYGGLARVWGPSLALGVATIVMPVVLAAAANRFFRIRFVRCATLLMLAFALASLAYRVDWRLAVLQGAPALALVPPAVFFMALACVLAGRLRANAATGISFAAAAFSLPVLGAHYLADAAAPQAGGAPWGFIALTYAAASPLVVAVLVVNGRLNTKDGAD